MKKNRVRIPIFLPIAIIVCLVLGFIGNQLLEATVTEEQLAENVLLGAIPFILIYASIILAFITFIVAVAQPLWGRIPSRVYRMIEGVIIAGIVLGIIGMFQPWEFEFYPYGFIVLLVTTLSFIHWSHIRLADRERQPELASTSVREVSEIDHG